MNIKHGIQVELSSTDKRVQRIDRSAGRGKTKCRQWAKMG